MKFTVADLLDQLPAVEALPISKLEKALGLTQKADKQHLQIGLEGLTKLGLLEVNEDGVTRRQDPELIPARLRCSSKGFCFALREDGGEDIYIRDHQLNHAWNGDRVLVKVTREGGRRRSPEGGVQCILERHTTSLLAQVEQQEERLVATPLDDRLLTAVELPPADASHLQAEQASVVEVLVDRYPVGQFAPPGHPQGPGGQGTHRPQRPAGPAVGTLDRQGRPGTAGPWPRRARGGLDPLGAHAGHQRALFPWQRP